MNIVEQAVDRFKTYQGLADKLFEVTGHRYQPGHVYYWKKRGYFPADIAGIVATHIFNNEITAFEACPSIKRAV